MSPLEYIHMHLRELFLLLFLADDNIPGVFDPTGLIPCVHEQRTGDPFFLLIWLIPPGAHLDAWSPVIYGQKYY